MYIITGGFGFIGSNLVRGLNAQGIEDIIVVDDLTQSQKFSNLVGCHIQDYLDKEEFIKIVRHSPKLLSGIDTIYHQGACTDTMEYDGKFMMENNFHYSKELLHFCIEKEAKFIYASSAAVYGNGTNFEEKFENEAPINIYGYSKYIFDQYVRRFIGNSRTTIVGLRYFNVFGPNESHKGKMASVIFQFYNQLKNTNVIKLFKGTDGILDGEQKRDFVHVSDVIRINLSFLKNGSKNGIYNVGSGNARSFNDVAKCMIDSLGAGEIEYIPFPEVLQNKYQNYTKANITSLRGNGYAEEFTLLEDGIKNYIELLQNEGK